MKQRAPVLPNFPTFQQLWDALGSRLIETAQGHMSYTQEVRGSSPLPPTIASILAADPATALSTSQKYASCSRIATRSAAPG